MGDILLSENDLLDVFAEIIIVFLLNFELRYITSRQVKLLMSQATGLSGKFSNILRSLIWLGPQAIWEW